MTQLKAQGPSKTCDESKEEEEEVSQTSVHMKCGPWVFRGGGQARTLISIKGCLGLGVQGSGVGVGVQGVRV